MQQEKITAKEIVKYQKGLEEYDVIVEQLTLNYAMNDKNPVDRVKFYDKDDKSLCFVFSYFDYNRHLLIFF